MKDLSDNERGWTRDDDVIHATVANARDGLLMVGGRYICSSEADETVLAAKLKSAGLSLSDSGQFEILGSLIVEAAYASVLDAIERHHVIAARNGYRLEAVEAGEPETGKAAVLASEPGYVPWWSIEASAS